MTQPTIHFRETMRGQGVLVTASGNDTIGNSPALPEDQSVVRKHVELGLDHQQPFTIAWCDLDVAVATQTQSNEGGLWGKIERGMIEIAGIDSTPLVLEEGSFELLPEVAPGQRRMRYQLRCHTADGQRHFTLYGFKQVAWQAGQWRLWALWQDTTTLYVTVYEHSADFVGDFPIEPTGSETMLVATGIIHISPLAFAHQLLTFRSTGMSSIGGHISNFWRFLRFFAGTLLGVYFVRSANPTPALPDIKEGA